MFRGDRLRLYPLNLMQVMLPKGIGINRFFVKPCGRGWFVLLFHGGKTMVKTSENTVREFALPASICPLLRVVPTKPMEVIINGKPTQTAAENLMDLVAEMGLPDRGVAVAIHNKMVPRTEWAATTLGGGEQIVIIEAAFGG